MLDFSAVCFADKNAVICVDRTLTFRELGALAANFAANIRSRGIAPGDVVTIWIENGWRWIAAYYGTLKLGAIVNPINVLMSPSEVDYIADDCHAKAIIGTPVGLRALAPKPGVTLIDSEQGLDALFLPPGDSASVPSAQPAPHSPATIAYTSGTTGHPKGAVLSHRAIILDALMTSLMHGRTSADIVVSALPCTHVYGNIVLNAAVACGMTLVLFPRFDEDAVVDAIARYGATLFEGVPTMYMRLLNHTALGRANLRTLQRCTVGGQTMPVSTMQEVEARFGVPLLELWGMTEIAGLGTTHPFNAPRRLGSIGVPLPMYEAAIASIEDPTRRLPPGEVGEFLIRGPSLMDGYLGNAEATKQAFTSDGYLRTGDLAHQDRDGYYFIVDRMKEMILTAGYNVYPAELERVIALHPAVAMVAVGKIPDEIKGERAKAYVVLRAGMTATADSIIQHCHGQLAAYKVPRHVAFVDDLPKTSTGKILRRQLHLLDTAPKSPSN
ncbi:MAG: AMP-binding protein [Steroidobacteraceae bacterium]